MRFKSPKKNGYCIYAVSGVNTVSFAVDSAGADTKDLLGFSVERYDPTQNERYFMPGFKVFKEVISYPQPNIMASTYEHPVQSFTWDDFTAKPEREYTYFFYPVKGIPKNLKREEAAEIKIKTEPLFSSLEHDVFFNRGAASSQAYARRFHNRPPDKLKGKEKEGALQWLSRELDEAIIKFIKQAGQGDALLACFYEFRYLPVVEAFKDAINRGAAVKIITDAKVNEYKDKEGFHESFPREDNLRAIRKAGIPLKNIIKRESNENDIQHNKFIIYMKGQKPSAVWTGSTNISEGGIFGQTNVGHWIRNEKTAEKYKEYWELLSADPGGKPGDAIATKRKDNDEFRKKVVAIQNDIEPDGIKDIPAGVTPIFSPRKGSTMLQTYAEMVDGAEKSAAITLAFGINKVFKDLLKDNTPRDQIIFMLLEKKDQPNPRSKDVFIKLGAKNNIYQAYGSYIRESLYQWAKETNARILKLNNHVSYIHSKFLLMDPLSKDPIVVTGSANFSDASTKNNDENMVIIRGNTRTADIYFTEFNRLFNHYYFRSVYEELEKRGAAGSEQEVFLRPDDGWLVKYEEGKYRYKKVQMFCSMEELTTL